MTNPDNSQGPAEQAQAPLDGALLETARQIARDMIDRADETTEASVKYVPVL